MYYKAETDGDITIYAENTITNYPRIRAVEFSEEGAGDLLMDNEGADVSSMTPISFG